jgi:hypothetical protein
MQAEHERLLREGWRLCEDGCYRKDGREKAFCTLCAAEPSSGFYTGCMVKDGHAPEWECDGGKLTRKPEPARILLRDALKVSLSQLRRDGVLS